MWVMGEWAVGLWIVGVTSFQKIYGLYGLKYHIVEISGDVTEAGQTPLVVANKQKKRILYYKSEIHCCAKVSMLKVRQK